MRETDIKDKRKLYTNPKLYEKAKEKAKECLLQSEHFDH